MKELLKRDRGSSVLLKPGVTILILLILKERLIRSMNDRKFYYLRHFSLRSYSLCMTSI